MGLRKYTSLGQEVIKSLQYHHLATVDIIKIGKVFTE